MSLAADWIIEKMDELEELSLELTLREHWMERGKCLRGDQTHCDY